jgi:3',5'-cyclic AMP phosphodiesterase CpdA
MGRVRLLHFSDIHLPPRRMGWRLREVFSKCITGWVNMRVLGRARRFGQAQAVLTQLFAHIQQAAPDGLLFTGDATHLAFRSEFFNVANLFKSLTKPEQTQLLAVPGNHDSYTTQAIREQRFEECFAGWQQGQRLGQHAYPFAMNIKGIWFLAVNSTTANLLPVDAGGAIGQAQLERLRELNKTLGPGRRILVTHYPLRTWNGELEHRLRRLRDHRKALEAAEEIGVSLWLHGHIHSPFYLPSGDHLPFPTICNGSTTQNKRWYFHEYTIDGNLLQAVRYRFNPEQNQFEESLRFELPLKEIPK